jgi:hypothetical protein
MPFFRGYKMTAPRAAAALPFSHQRAVIRPSIEHQIGIGYGTP